MPPITVEAIQAKQSEITTMIQQMLQSLQGTKIEIKARTINLQPGERYIGARLDAQGNHLHDVIVLAKRPEQKQKWHSTMDQGIQCGGDVASPEEYALIKANCPDLLTESAYWTNKTHKDDASSAWYFHSDGLTTYRTKSASLSALFVRRV